MMRNPKMNKKKMNGKTRGRGCSGSSANNTRMGGDSFTPTKYFLVRIDKPIPVDYSTYLRLEDKRLSTPEHLLGKNDLCIGGYKIVKGASHRLSKVLRTRYKDVIAIKTDLEARPINQDTKFLLDSIEYTIRIVKRFRKRTKDLPFDHSSGKFIESLKWDRMISSYLAKARIQKVSKPCVSRPDFQRTPRVRKVQGCSTLCELNQPPFMIDSRVVFSNAHELLANDSYTYSPNAHEEKICLEFIEFDKKTHASKEKLSIKVEHPIVSIIGNYAINAFNGAFEQHVLNDEHNRLRHFEFLECKFLKFDTGYHFDVTIEAFEEGYIGTYRTEVIWNIDFPAITVCTFVLTNRKPFGTKALAVHYLSRIRPINIGVLNLCRYKACRLESLRRRNHGLARAIAKAEINRIRRLVEKTIEGLKRRQYQDIKLLFPSDCYRPTKRDRCSHPAASSVMMRRKKDKATYGYDFFNPNAYMRSPRTGPRKPPLKVTIEETKMLVKSNL